MNNFLKKAYNKFNNRFDYSNINYKSYDYKINVKCIEHDINFYIFPSNHLKQINGGCNACRKNNKKKIILRQNEIIKNINIDGLKNLYSISSHGRCFSNKSNKELNTHICSGYKKVNLYFSNRNLKQYLIHYLVYITFFDDYDKKYIIDHKDGNKINNNINNLQCISQSDNVKNAYKNNKKMYQQNTIQMLDKITNKVLKEFNSTNDAYKYINHKNKTSILQCLNGIYKSAGGFKWKFKDNDITINKKNKYIKNIDDFKCIGIINNKNYSNYYINSNGVIINIKYNNRKIKNFTNANNYKCCHLYYDSGKKTQMLVHRLLGKIFLQDGDEKFNNIKYVINHKDQNRCNNKLSNLEWITQKKNTIHGRGKKIGKIDKKTNKLIKIYNSITEAYEELDKPWNSLISKVCMGKRKTIYGYKWKYM
jgi:hypothetical protein